ncbi:MAG: hypothetical protein E3J26_01355 [Candidatus Zixiibacteriota bacterium]|nr:MAG: hypothetical protein E3J26_01355 [candidate division Zixibacteria bacterium]
MILGQQFSLSDLPQKDITFDCHVEPTPEFGKEFTVTVTFSLNEETRYVDNLRAGAEARIGMFPRQQFISGDTLITGRLSVGEMYTMTATYRAINRGEMHIGLNLKIRGEADSTGKEKLHGYTVTRRLCGFYRIGLDVPTVRETILDSATGLKIRLLPPGDPTVPRPKVPWPVSPPDEKPVETPEELKIKKRIEEPEQSHGPFLINIELVYLQKQPDGSYRQAKKATVSKDFQWRLIFKDAQTKEILSPTFPKSENELGRIEKSKDSAYIFTPKDSAGTSTYKGKVNGSDFMLKLDISSIWRLGTYTGQEPARFGRNENQICT